MDHTALQPYKQETADPQQPTTCLPFGSGQFRWVKWLPQNRPLTFLVVGRYKGRAITELLSDYLSWILENAELKKPLYDALDDEFERGVAV